VGAARRCVLSSTKIDEAHHLRTAFVEDLRLLTNYTMDFENRLTVARVGSSRAASPHGRDRTTMRSASASLWALTSAVAPVVASALAPIQVAPTPSRSSSDTPLSRGERRRLSPLCT
jgi:hypothetical protein